MFFKSKKEKLQDKYNSLLEEAMKLQRSGKIPEYAKKTAEADAIYKELEAIKD